VTIFMWLLLKMVFLQQNSTWHLVSRELFQISLLWSHIISGLDIIITITLIHESLHYTCTYMQCIYNTCTFKRLSHTAMYHHDELLTNHISTGGAHISKLRHTTNIPISTHFSLSSSNSHILKQGKWYVIIFPLNLHCINYVNPEMKFLTYYVLLCLLSMHRS